MKKIVVTGWMPRNAAEKRRAWDRIGPHGWLEVFPRRGCRINWHEEDWPPKKVRITIEEYDKEVTE